MSAQFSWKLLHPTAQPEDADDYEKATKYNYSAEEKSALAEVIGMIKSVQQTALGMQARFSRSIHAHVYSQLQRFVQVELREPLRKFGKHKKDIPIGCVAERWWRALLRHIHVLVHTCVYMCHAH